jgi:hypothetical protein
MVIRRLLMKIKSLPMWCVVGALLCVSYSASAGVFYRYTDESGHVVMARTVPPHIVPSGYEVLNEKGRVIDVVAPALTDAEKKARDDLLAQKALEEQARKEQLEEDKRLLRQYSGPADAVALMQRRISEVDSVIQSRRATIEVAKKNIGELEEKAANFQRNGKSVPNIVLDQIAAEQKDIEVSKSVIAEKLKSRGDLVNDFEGVIERLEQLTGKKVSDGSESK